MAEGRSKLALLSAGCARTRGQNTHSPVGVDTTEKLGLQVHVVEAANRPVSALALAAYTHLEDSLVDDLVPVGLDLILLEILEGAFAAAKPV